MVSRKRRHSHTSETLQDAYKRARLLTDSLNFQRESESLDESSNYSASSSGTVYQIKAIIGERRHEYLIDWANDSATGATFEPDWVSLFIFVETLASLHM